MIPSTTLPARLLSGTVVSALGRVIGTVLSIGTIGVVTRSLAHTGGVAAYGSYAAIFAFLAVVSVVADGGLHLTFTRAAVAVDAVGEALLLRRILVLRLLTLVVAIALTSLVLRALRYETLLQQGILLGSIGIAAQLAVQPALGVFQKRLRMFAPAAAEVAGRAVTLALVLVLAVRGSGGVLAFVGAFVAGAIITLAVNLRALARHLPLFQRTAGPRPPLPSLWSIAKETLPLGVLLILWMVVFRADSVLLAALRPAEDLGWYALPYKILESLLFFPAMIGGLLFPALARRSAAAAEPVDFQETVRAATSLFLLLVLPAVGILFLLAPGIITLLGGDAFTPSVPILRILALALGALFFGNLYGNAAIALGAQRPLLWTALFLAVGNILVNLVVIPRFSFRGAAWTTLGTEALSALGAAGIVSRRMRSLPFAASQLHILSAGGAFFLCSLLPLPLLVRVSLGLAGYGGTLWFLGVLTPRRLTALLRAQRV